MSRVHFSFGQPFSIAPSFVRSLMHPIKSSIFYSRPRETVNCKGVGGGEREKEPVSVMHSVCNWDSQ